MKVAIQGIAASFHDMAAQKYFGKESIEIVECSSFPKLFKALDTGEADYAVMAIENAIAGSILPNYALMEKYLFKVIGEVYLKIDFALMALPGTVLDDIEYIQSHPMALLQCQDFLQSLEHVKLLEHSDTADSAFEIKDKNLKNYASIASHLAAETYGLEILRENIRSSESNFTRFLILDRKSDNKTLGETNKASICFETRHEPGSLVKILNIFQKHSVNMDKIQSIPVIGKPHHYSFHVDLEWKNRGDYDNVIKDLMFNSVKLTHFGEYIAGEKPFL